MNQELSESTRNGHGRALVLPLGRGQGGHAYPASGDEMQPWDAGADVEPWPEVVDGGELLNGLVAFIGRYVVLGESAVETLALWVLHTYAFHLRDVAVYVGVESPQKRCGKTTLLTVLSEVVNRPIVAANISSPAFFRVIEEMHPTLMIDEADTALHRNDELRGILNSGYKRKTAYVVRVASEAWNRDEAGRGENGAVNETSGEENRTGEEETGGQEWQAPIAKTRREKTKASLHLHKNFCLNCMIVGYSTAKVSSAGTGIFNRSSALICTKSGSSSDCESNRGRYFSPAAFTASSPVITSRARARCARLAS